MRHRRREGVRRKEAALRRGRSIVRLVLPVLLIVGAAAAQEAADLSGRARAVLFRAEGHREEGDPAAAADVLREYLRAHAGEDHYLLRAAFAGYLAAAGQADSARAQYRRALTLQPDHAPSWLGLARTAYETEQYAEAAEAFLRGYELMPDADPAILYYAATAYLQAGEREEALRWLLQLVSGDYGIPPLAWFRALTAAAVPGGEDARVTAALREMLAIHADDPEAWRLYHDAAAAAGDYREAALGLTVSGYLRPLPRDELLRLGDLYYTINVPRLAYKYYEEARADTGTVAEIERLASAYVAAHEETRARTLLEEVLARAPSPRLWSLLGDLHYAAEEYAETLNAFRACAALDSTYGRAYLMIGYCALELERLPEAREALERATTFPEQSTQAEELLERLQFLTAEP